MTRTEPTFYQRRIADLTQNVDPRHAEAWIRLEHPTLDGLSAAEFERGVEEALLCIRAAGPDESEALAASFGL
jgi:hypothetical protein